MKVFLVLPPAGKKYNWAQQMPPLGISYIGAILTGSGHKVFVYDASLDDSIEPAVNAIAEFKPQLVGISSTTLQIKNSAAIANRVKSFNRDIVLVSGGTHVTALARAFLEHYESFDIVVKGEGEHTMLELVNYLEGGMPLTQVRGILYRKGGSIIENQPRPLIKDIDSIPFASRLFRSFSLNGYHAFEDIPLESQKNMIRASMMASRGCPYSCTFCYCPAMWGCSYRRRSPKNIVDEIEYLISEHKVNYIRFYDDNFCVFEEHVLEMCKLIKQRGLKFQWRCEARVGPSVLSKNMLRQMRESGCHMVELGVESGSKRMLESIKKQITLPMIENAFRLCHEAGMETKAFIICALPGERTIDTLRTIRLLSMIKPEYVNLATCQILPGTEIYNTLVKKGLINPKIWFDFNYGKTGIPRYYEFLNPFKKYLILIRRKLLSRYCHIKGFL